MIAAQDVERVKSAVGQAFPHRTPAWNQTNDRSSISHFAYGYGDPNPLWHSRGYGATTRWHDQIAPPTYLIAAGIDALARYPGRSERVSLGGLFRGTNRLHVTSNWEWFLPIFPGDDVFRSGRVLSGIRQRRANGDRAVEQIYEVGFINQAGSVVATQSESYLNLSPRPPASDRPKAGQDGSGNGRLGRYSPEDLDRIDQAYQSEWPRGADPRFWEDVEAGQELSAVVKGPMTVVDVVSMHQGMGWGGMPVGPFRFGWYGRQSSPGYYELDERGVYQVIQRVHWDHEYALSHGFPAPYDYGLMRACWLSQAVTHWMGDNAWLWRLSVSYRGLNLLGDTHWVAGKVAETKLLAGHTVARLDLQAVNQTGTATTTGSALVILPSREGYSLRLPHPAPAREKEILSRFDLSRPYSRGSGSDPAGSTLPVPVVDGRNAQTERS